MKSVGAVIAVFLIALGVFYLGFRHGYGRIISGDDTITVIRFDTITITDVRPEYVYIHHYDTIKLPAIDLGDNITVSIPISKYVFTDDTTFRAFVSGYGVTLDTIDVYSKTITNTIIKTTPPPTIIPFVSASYSTTKHFGVGGGMFYKQVGFEYNYQFSLGEMPNAHLFKAMIKF